MDARRKKLIFRSWHRGTKEMDLILGRFSDEFIPTASESEIDQYETMLEEIDPDLYNWISKREDVPMEKQSNGVLMALVGYQVQKTG